MWHFFKISHTLLSSSKPCIISVPRLFDTVSYCICTPPVRYLGLQVGLAYANPTQASPIQRLTLRTPRADYLPFKQYFLASNHSLSFLYRHFPLNQYIQIFSIYYTFLLKYHLALYQLP